MTNPNNKIATREFAASFATAFSGAIEQSTGSAWQLEVSDGHDTPPRSGQPFQFRIKIDGGISGECFVEFYDPHASELLEKLTEGQADTAPEERGKLLASVITSANSGLKTALSSKFGEVNFKVDIVSGLAFGGMLVVAMKAPSERSSAAVLLYFDGQLVDTLSPAAHVEEDAPADIRSAPPANLKLVMDVELNVTLRFGQRQLPLREVLELASGSVIELDRMVDEPVELLLDGKLVARGEAVIVDGNYGLRVTEIPQAVETHFLR